MKLSKLKRLLIIAKNMIEERYVESKDKEGWARVQMNADDYWGIIEGYIELSERFIKEHEEKNE